MQTIKGTVTKIRLLTFTSSPLVRFTVGTTNCLINRHSLSFFSRCHGRHVFGGCWRVECAQAIYCP